MWETARTSQIPAQVRRNNGLDRRVPVMYAEFAAYVGPYIGYARKSPVDDGLICKLRSKGERKYLRGHGSAGS